MNSRNNDPFGEPGFDLNFGRKLRNIIGLLIIVALGALVVLFLWADLPGNADGQPRMQIGSEMVGDDFLTPSERASLTETEKVQRSNLRRTLELSSEDREPQPINP